MIAHRLLRGHWPLSAVSVLQGHYSAVEPPSALSVPSLRLAWLWSHIAKAILLGQVRGLISTSPVTVPSFWAFSPSSQTPIAGGGAWHGWGRVADYEFILSVLFKSLSLSFGVSSHPTRHSPMILPASTRKQRFQADQCLQANGWKNSRLPGTEKPSHWGTAKIFYLTPRCLKRWSLKGS